MNGYQLLRAMCVPVVLLGVASSTNTLWGAGPADAVHFSLKTTIPAIVDVKLAPGGILRGRIVDVRAVGISKADVFVRQANGELTTTKTDIRGDFAISGLRGGVHQVVSGPVGCVVRAWAPKTAPPVAREGILIVVGQDLVLGQHPTGPIGRFWENSKYALTNPLVMTGIIATAIAVPVALNNRDKDSGS